MKKKLDCYLVDDELQAIHALTSLLQNYCSDMVEIVGSTTDYYEAWQYLSENEPALLFIDINKETNNGWELLGKCGPLINTSIHVTATSSDFAFEAYKLGVTNYLLKPITPEELIFAIRRIYTRREIFKIKSIQQFIKSQKEKIFIPDSKGWASLNLKEIVLLQSDNSYTHIVLENDEVHIITKNLGALEEYLLPFDDFVRVSKSYIVNINHVLKIKKQDGGILVLTGNLEIPISTGFKKDVMDILLERLNMLR